jgi:hypothetical protein
MANNGGWFRVTAQNGQNITITEEGGEGRVITIPAYHIGEVYAGHCNPRFVTEQAVTTYRAGL